MPAEVRRHLGLAAGSVVEWDLDGAAASVRRVGKHNSEDIHRALFPAPPRPHSLAEMKDGIRSWVRGKRL